MIETPETCTLCQSTTPPFKINGQTLIGTIMKPYAICVSCYNNSVPNGVPEKVAEARKKLMKKVMSRLKSRKGK